VGQGNIDPEEEQRRIEEALRPVVAAVLDVVNFTLPEETWAVAGPMESTLSA
jgi:hypothetical protein